MANVSSIERQKTDFTTEATGFTEKAFDLEGENRKVY